MQSKTELVESIKKFVEETSGLKVREHETKSAYVIQLGITDPVSSKFNKDSYKETEGEDPVPEDYKYYAAVNLLQLWADTLSEGNREVTEEWVQVTEQVN